MSDHEIERIAEYHDGDKVWRTTCKCMGDDHLTFTVATDDECPEVYLECYIDCSTQYSAFHEAAWQRPFIVFWRRLVGAFSILTKGYVETNGAFLFRGEKQIDAVTETIQAHKKYMIERRKTAPYKEVGTNYYVTQEQDEKGTD